MGERVLISETWYKPFTAAIIASAIPAAIRPYSIAVAPDSSDRNFKTVPKAASTGKFREWNKIYGTSFKAE